MRTAVIIGACLALAAPARAEPWYRGPRGHHRVVHVSVTAAAGLAFLVSETVLKPTLAPDACRWCAPPSLDVTVRDKLVWTDRDSAGSFSNLTGYVAAPVFALGITALSSLSTDDPTWGQLIDDTIPVFETVAFSELVTQAAKFSVGRQRPYAHYADASFMAGHDDNLSFYSGHSVLAFSLATSAGMVAHWRHARNEPVVWAVGMTLAASTAYLRIAADRHYFSDVVVGTAVGVAAGLTVPRLMHRGSTITLVPAPNGVSLAGAF